MVCFNKLVLLINPPSIVEVVEAKSQYWQLTSKQTVNDMRSFLSGKLYVSVFLYFATH